ncbi:MAG: hypothetical protein JWO38_6298 [Gemmataceae bacterium]|nr:hypothetical protein [Gemmataceae bacterium]
MPNPFRMFARLHPVQRLAVVLWAMLLLGVAGRVLFAPVRSHTVVPIYLTAAERWVQGEAIYAPAPPLDIYRNPPGVAAAFVPLTWMPERLAGLAWRGLSVGFFLYGLGVWVRRGLPRPLTPGESGAVFALAVLPAIPSVNNGQTNLAIIGALLLGAAAAASARGFVGGLWLALAAAVKVYPLAVGLLVAAARPRRLLPGLLVWGAVFAAVPFVLQDRAYVAAEYDHFRAYLGTDDRSFAEVGRAPQDLFFVLRMWASPPPPGVYLAITLAAAAGMAGLVVLAAYRSRDPRVSVPLAFHLGCVWITVLGPATEPHTYIILAPTAAAVLVLARGGAHHLRFGLAAVGYVFLVAPILRDTFPNGKTFHGLALQPIGGLLVLAAAVWGGVRDALAVRAVSPGRPIAPPAHNDPGSARESTGRAA